MTKVEVSRIEESFEKYTSGAAELLEALQFATGEELEIFDRNYKLSNSFEEHVAEIQEMESEFIFEIRRKHGRITYGICKDSSGTEGLEEGWTYAIRHYLPGYYVEVKDWNDTTSFISWDTFKNCIVEMEKEVYDAIQELEVIRGYDCSSIKEAYMSDNK